VIARRIQTAKVQTAHVETECTPVWTANFPVFLRHLPTNFYPISKYGLPQHVWVRAYFINKGILKMHRTNVLSNEGEQRRKTGFLSRVLKGEKSL
jgi:hypothetical protein